MKKNVGTNDRLFRFALGLIIGILGIWFDSWWGLLGIIPIFFGLIRWCPVYVPFKMSTTKKEE